MNLTHFTLAAALAGGFVALPVLAEPDEADQQQEAAYVGDPYPMATCPVSGGDLDAMGGPVDSVVANRLVKLCCAGCVPAVEENPAKVLAKVHGEAKADDGHAGHDH